MEIDRTHVVQVLRAAGRTEDADRAEQVLGVRVDTERDADLLRGLGLDPDSRAQGGGLAVRSGGTSDGLRGPGGGGRTPG